MLKPGFTIIGLDVRRFAKIKAVHLNFDGNNLVRIGGKNRQGKSTILNAIYSCLAGIPKSVKAPITTGETDGAIRLTVKSTDGADTIFKIVRLFENNLDGKQSNTLQIFNESGKRISERPSDFLRRLMGLAFIDPMAFPSKDPRDQRKILATLAGVEVDELDRAIKAAKAEIDIAKNRQTQLSYFADLPFHEDAPDTELDPAEIALQLSAANTHNSRKTSLNREIEIAAAAMSRQKTYCDEAKADITSAELLLQKAKAYLADVLAKTEEATVIYDQAVQNAQDYTLVDVGSLESALAAVQVTNKKIRDNAAYLNAKAEYEAQEQNLKTHVDKWDVAKKAKLKALSEAAFPVAGLGFEDDGDGITLNGLPFSQASHAEQIQSSVAISAAMGGELKAFCIYDASTLDSDSMKILLEESQKIGAQVFAEIVVDEEDYDANKADIIIVDGEVYNQSATPATEQVGLGL